MHSPTEDAEAENKNTFYEELSRYAGMAGRLQWESRKGGLPQQCSWQEHNTRSNQ